MQSLERGSSSSLSTKFGKEIPSRNMCEKGQNAHGKELVVPDLSAFGGLGNQIPGTRNKVQFVTRVMILVS